jgi:hypothetical protein
MILNIPMTNELPKIEDILIKPEDILREVKDIVSSYRMNYLEATVYYCEKNNYDTEAISKIIPQSLKTLIEQSAKELRLFKKNHNNVKTLPI